MVLHLYAGGCAAVHANQNASALWCTSQAFAFCLTSFRIVNWQTKTCNFAHTVSGCAAAALLSVSQVPDQ